MKRNKQKNSLVTVAWIMFSLILGLTLWVVVSNDRDSYRTYLVQSGSMEPAILVGDVIVINKYDNYAVNDVITFKNGGEKRVTHRIISIKKERGLIIYSTKGDANRSGDRETVPTDQVLGKVVLAIPKLGYLINFLRTPIGFLFIIILPAIWIVLSEIIAIKKGNFS